MGITSGLIAISIIVVVLSIYGNQLESQVNTFVTTQQQAQITSTNAKALAIPTNVPGQNICSLHITFKPQLTNPTTFSTIALRPQDLNLQISGGASYSWFNCNVNSKPTTASLIPQVNNFYYQMGTSLTTGLDIISIGGQTIHMNLVIEAPDGTMQSYTTNPFLTQSVSLPSGNITIPQTLTFDYVVYNIPRQQYSVAVTSDIPINGGAIGVAYIQNVSP